MEFYLLVSAIVTTIFVSILVHRLLLPILHRNKENTGKNLKPPQAKGAWPIIGHLHLLGGPELPHKVLGDMADKHGPVFAIKLGVHQALVVSDAAIAKECFTTNDKAFASRPKMEASKIMAYNYAVLGRAPYGDYWRKMRKMLVLEVLSQRRVEMLGHIRASEVRASVKELYDVWVTNKLTESSESQMVKVEMSQWFGNLLLNIIVRIVSGKRFLPNDEEGVRFQAVAGKYIELFGAFLVADFIPYLNWLDVGGYKKLMKNIGKDLDNIFDRWLKEHKQESKYIHQHEANQDFMHVLISILRGASKEEFPGFDHDTIIKATSLQVLAAGVETTSVTLTWALALLLNNPKALETAQEEIDEHVGRDRLVEESDLKNLVYLNAIIKETLRLYPAGPLSVPHESVEDCIVGGYNIPKGTRLVVNLWKLQRDPNIWSDPTEFKPERFLTSHKDIDVKGNHYELLTFGSGRRMCPGVLFALQVLGLTLARLIQQFVLKKPTNEPIDMTESMGATNVKKTPLDVLLGPRLATDMYKVG
ncbi:cytochrome P450 CYP82D47 [Lactuca sativa]|uniref:cytochrome P450 CYP82D47 n=1 Tax=Lactuca sativa TaxID=4236 RepID=UPI000CAD039B|nr:cytochrome P450 CYP82D47 [Lactuca sativa]